MIRCDDLEKYTVRISYDQRQGSGIIFLPNEDSNYSYILTAKHNFKDSNDKLIPKENLSLKKIKIEYREFDDVPFSQILCEDIIYHDELDLAIIIVSADTVKKVILKLSQLSILSIESFSQCIFKGYPCVSKSSSTCLDGKYKERAERTTFKIKVDDLASYHQSEFQNTRGFSGSGVLTPFNNEPFLVGLILEVKSAFNELKCLDFRYIDINSILEEADYPPIKVESKEVFEDIESKAFEVIQSINPKLSSEDTQKNLDKIKEILQKRQTRSSFGDRMMMFSLSSDISVFNNETDNTDDLNKEALKYLENGNILGAKEVLESIAIPNGETYRLKALLCLQEKDISSANEYIEKAKENKANAKEIDFTQGLIYYFSSLQEDGYTNLNPYPIDSIYIKYDRRSLENIKKAQSIFLELSERNENIDYDTWYLASLHLINLEQTYIKSKKFIEEKPNHFGAIIYIVAFGFDIDLSNSIKYINAIENKNLQNIIDLINCNIHMRNYSQALTLLVENKDSFEDKVLLEKSYINIYRAQTLFDEALEIIDNSTNETIKKLKQFIIIEKLFFNKHWNELIKIYIKDDTSLGLFRLCKIKAILNDWKFVASKVDTLVDNLENISVFDLVITALYNNKEYEKALNLLEKYSEIFGELTDKLKRIKSNSLNKIGNTNQAISILEGIKEKGFDDINNLIYQYNKMGSFNKIESLALNIIDDENIPYHLKISTASIIKNKNNPLAQKLISNIDLEKLSDEQVAGLIPISLESKDEKLRSILFPRWNKLIEQDEKYGVKLHIDDFLKFFEEQTKRSSEIFEKYKYNLIGFHFLDNSKIYFDKLFSSTDTPLFIRAGNKAYLENFNTDIENIYLDISSIFILYRLELLELIIEKYNVYIPPYFIQMISNHIYEYEKTCKELIQVLSIYIQKEKVKFTHELEPEELKERDYLNLELLNFMSFTKTKIKDNSAILVDDRFINTYITIDTTLIYGINDLLKTLYKKEIITQEEYFQKILILREKKLLFLPFEDEEFLFHLFNAELENDKLIETRELKVFREYFNYTYKNLKYLTLKHKESTKIEAHYVGHIHTFIGRLFCEIWRKDKDNWNMYFDYLVENFLVINSIYFIKDKVEYYDEAQFVAMSISSMLYLSIFVIVDDLKEYIDRINFKLLEPIVYRDSDIFNNLVGLLKYNLKQEYNEDKEYQDLLESLHIKFINSLPYRLRDKILDDTVITKKYKFIQTTSLNGKNIDRNELIRKVSSVLKYNIKEIIKDQFEIYLDKDILLLKDLTTNETQVFSHEFYIMSPSLKVQKEVLNDNPKWFDFKDSKIIKYKKSILVLNNPIERFLKLEYYRNMSGDSYYEFIFDDLKESGMIDFSRFIPENIETVASHYRFLTKGKFKTNKKVSIKKLLNEDDIALTLERLCSLPQELPNDIYVKLNSLGKEEKIKLLERFRNVASTPLNRFHFIKIVSKCLDEKLAKRIIKKSIIKIPRDILLEIKAYLSVYKWVYVEFKYKFNITEELLIMLSFGHTDRLFKNFKAVNIKLEQIVSEFSQRTRNYLDDILNKRTLYDVLDPFEIDEYNFLFKGLHYALGNDMEFIKNDKFISLIYSNKEKEIPYFELFKDQSLLSNCCSSFLNKDYSEFFTNLIGEKKNIYSKNSIEKFVESIFKDLKNNPANYEQYSVLNIVFKHAPIYSQYCDIFVELILNIDFSKLENIYQLSILKLASNQNIYLKSVQIEQHLKNVIVSLCKDCSSNDVLIKYFDIIIYLSIGSSNNLEDRIRYLCTVLKESTTESNKEILKYIISSLVFQFPIKQSNLLVEFLLELREM